MRKRMMLWWWQEMGASFSGDMLVCLCLEGPLWPRGGGLLAVPAAGIWDQNTAGDHSHTTEG